MSTGEFREIFGSTTYIGGARWSPDSALLSFTGPDYGSIVVTDADGVLLTSFKPEDMRLSGRVNGPRWIDDDTIVYYDAVPALLEGSVSTGDVDVTALYDVDDGRDFIPVLSVPLPK
jgi:hypothetical protein